MRWLVVSSGEIEKLPVWKRTVGISKDGSIFVPAAIGGIEKAVSTSTLRDKISVRIRDNHVYVPMVWLAENYPRSLDECWILGSAAFKSSATRIGMQVE
ncbi:MULTISPECIES: hypothetical protein [Pseudomonas]|uniref:hypothetical protein n=1 Tax=Pseudomonas TaxID=286 RepID=UPI00115FE666|nr:MULTISPECIES: hypothetical protein [Pseudomonas]